jgi:DNA-binding MarR family transcriptional regulator
MSEPTHIKDILAEKTIILEGADLLSARGFTQVPNHILESSKISAGAKLTYAMLLKYAWENDFCFPGQDRLADDMGLSRQTANKYIKELEKKDFIKIRRQGQGRPNIYTLKLTVDKGKNVDNSR